MPAWIKNLSLHDIQQNPTPCADVYIQIVDPDMDFPLIENAHARIYQFQFLDLDYDFPDHQDHPLAIQTSQAEAIARILEDAWNQQHSIIVHCHAGVCRSGAVIEAALALGYPDPEIYRSPNRKVKHAILHSLGLPFDPQEPLTINGTPFVYDDLNNPILIPSSTLKPSF